MDRPLRILSIDGGGIRGIIPAVVLAALEERTRTPVCRLFDLIAGTSTGGILALGLTRPDAAGQPVFTAAQLINLYLEEGPRIFSRSVWHRLRALDNLAEEKYPAAGLEEVLDRYLGPTRLREALGDVLVTAYEIERRLPFFFRSSRARENPAYDFPMTQVARAATAAPTYFEPARIEISGPSDYYALVDGGVYAGNPAMCAYAEACNLYPGRDLLVVSLGTGVLTRRLPYPEVKRWGLASWAQPLVDVVFGGVSDTVDYQLRQLLPGKDGRSRYFRFQTILYQGSDDLDDAGAENLIVLKLLGEEIVQKNSDSLDILCRQIV
ncbi:MAG: patatin [Candidatus Zixiibacteriota bacterium]|nr:MAG: patatin [candidate division Zixibacteria bacterium]